MNMLSKLAVRHKCLFSPAHIARMEKAGHFPKRVRLSQGRVGWIESEVDDWLKARVAERDANTGSK